MSFDIFCFYCWQTFETELKLIEHQKLHFKCQDCQFIIPQLPSLLQLKEHSQSFHKKPLTKVPFSIPEAQQYMYLLFFNILVNIMLME